MEYTVNYKVMVLNTEVVISEANVGVVLTDNSVIEFYSPIVQANSSI